MPTHFQHGNEQEELRLGLTNFATTLEDPRMATIARCGKLRARLQALVLRARCSLKIESSWRGTEAGLGCGTHRRRPTPPTAGFYWWTVLSKRGRPTVLCKLLTIDPEQGESRERGIIGTIHLNFNPRHLLINTYAFLTGKNPPYLLHNNVVYLRVYYNNMVP